VVFNLVPDCCGTVGNPAMESTRLPGVRSSGCAAVLQDARTISGNNVASWEGTPRIVGEASGKNPIFSSVADDLVARAGDTARGSFEGRSSRIESAKASRECSHLAGSGCDQLAGSRAKPRGASISKQPTPGGRTSGAYDKPRPDPLDGTNRGQGDPPPFLRQTFEPSSWSNGVLG
jgi:hypothetical protein